MSDKYTMEVLRIAAAQICQNVGYTSTMASALDVMQDVLYRISKELTRDLKLAAEHCNRRRPNLTDVAWTLRNCNIDLKAFSDYLDNVEPVPPAIEVPRYPVRRPEDPEYWKPKDLDQYIQQQQQLKQQQQQSTINGKREDDDEDVEVIVAKKEEEEDEREGGEGRAEEQNDGQKIKTEGDLEVEAIENDAKREEGDESNLENMEALKTKEESEVNTKKTKGVISSDFVPTIIYKYLHYDVPPPPTPSPPTPTPTPELSPPHVDIQTGGENLTAPLATTTTITASKTPMSLQQNENEKRDEIFDENPLQQQQQQPQQLQQKIKKHKKHKLPIDFVGGGELMMPMMNEKTPNSIAIEKRKKSLKRAIKQQQEQFNNEFLFDQQQQQQHQLNPLQLEKLQKKQERLKLKQLKQQQKRKKLQEQEMLQQQQQQQQQFQPIQKQTLVAENHDLFMVNNNKQQQQPQLMKTESPNFLTTTPTMATTTTIATNNVLEKVKTEFDYYNSNNNSNNNNNNHNDVHKNILQQQQQQQQFDVNLPNLPTGTTITPAPPIMTPTPAVAPPPPPTAQKPLIPIGATTTTPNQPIANSNNVVALVKPGKKRGRKPGSKNQPKISLQQQQLLLLQKHMAPAMGDLMGGIRMNENVSKLFKQPTFPTPGIFNQPKIYGQQTPDNPLIGSAGAHGGGVGGAIDLTTTTTPTPPNNYLIPHQQPQTPFNPAVHFNHPNLYPFAATARPGLIPGGGIPFFPTQSQASLPMEFLKQFKHHDNFMLPQHQQLQQQQQQQMLKNNNNGGSGGATGGGGDLYKNVCNIPPLLPEHLKIPSQQQQSQQQMAKQQKSQALKKVKNFTPSETIDLLSDDSNDNYPEISTKLPPKQQKQQQPFLYPLQQQQHSEAPQQQNNRKSTKKQQQHLQQDILLSTLQQQQQSSSSSTTLSVPPISKLAGGADLIPLTNTGLAYSSQNIPHTSLTGGGGCQLGVGGGGGSTVDTLLGDITITKTTTTNNSNNNSILMNESNQQLQQQQLQQHDEQSLLLKKNKHSKKDKKFKKIKEGKINKKNKKEKKDKDKKHKLEKILLKQQQQQQQQQHHHDNNILDDRELLKKQKREKKKEKQRRMAESMSSNLNELEQRSPSNAGSSPSIPKLTLKLAGKNSPITTMSPITTTPTTTKEPVEIVGNIGEEQQQPQQQHQQQYQQSSREYSPELAKFSPLVTRPPKQKATSALSPTPHLSQSQSQPTPIQAPPAPQQQPQQTNVVVVPPPPPSSWTSGDTFPASSVLLPSQLFGGLNDPPILPATSSSTTKSKDNVSVIKTPSNVDFINDIKPHSYVDEEGHMIWICPACGKVDDGSPMIGCDGCDAWYHWACVGITVAPKQNEDWFCRVCIMRNMAPSMANMSDSSNKKRKRTKKK